MRPWHECRGVGDHVEQAADRVGFADSRELNQ